MENKNDELLKSIEEILMKNLNPEKKAKRSFFKGSKAVAVPVNFFKALKKPFDNFKQKLDEMKAAAATVGEDEKAIEDMDKINEENNEELAQYIKADEEQSDQIENDVPVVQPIAIEPEVTVQPVTIEPVITVQPIATEPEVTVQPIVTEQTNEEYSSDEIEMPVITEEPIKKVEPTIAEEMTPDLYFKFLLEKKENLKNEIKAKKSQKQPMVFAMFDEIVEKEDELDEVIKQIKHIEEQRELEQAKKDEELEAQLANENNEVEKEETAIKDEFKEEVQQTDEVKEDVVENNVEPVTPEVEPTPMNNSKAIEQLANFVVMTIKEKEEENIDIDLQIAKLLAKKESNNKVIQEYAPLISNNVEEVEENTYENYSEDDFKKARVMSKINEIKSKLRDESNYDANNSLRVELVKLEGVLAGMEFNEKTKTK